MSSAERTRWRTAADFLLGDSGEDEEEPADPVDILSRSVNEHGVARSGIKGLRHLSGSAMRAVTRELAAAILESLELVDLRDLLAGGWSKHKDLIAAAERTHAVPGSEELVTLAAHRIVSTHHPSVDLIVKEAKVYTCAVDLSVEFDLNGVQALVRQGELVALRGGTSVITARLTMGEVPLVPPLQRSVDLAKFITLNRPIRLLAKTATPPEG